MERKEKGERGCVRRRGGMRKEKGERRD